MELTLPLLGDVMTEGTLASWFQVDGAFVEAGEPLYQVETDKVNLTVDAPESGTLQRVVAEGETVPVGTLVGRLLSESVVAIERPAAHAEERVRATPAARSAARRLGVDLRHIANGRRLRLADVEAIAQPLAEGQALSGRRKVIAERMRSSLANSAQLTVSMEVDMTDAVRVRDQLKELLGDRRPTITDLVIRASVLALREHPALNATLVDGRLTRSVDVHVGVAVDAEDGLIVPIIRNAHQMDLVTLAERSRSLVDRARRNGLTPDDVQGGTFTVTSLGALGVDFFTPIVNPPQVAILGVGRVFDKIALQGGTVVVCQAMHLNLSFDHQAVDGAPAARFLQSIKRYLELPAGLCLPSGGA